MAKKVATDDKVMGLIKEVERQKAEIAKCDKPNWRTNCSFCYAENKPNDAVNIHVETNVRNLVCIAAFLQDKARSYKEAAVALGVEAAPDFTWGGYSVADWLEDLKLRITKIQIGAKRKKLEVLESRLNSLVSPELRAELELSAIASELNL